MVRKLNGIRKETMNKKIIMLLSGIAIGLLLAPAKGSETLNRVANKLSDLKNRFVDKTEDMFILEGEEVQNENVETLS